MGLLPGPHSPPSVYRPKPEMMSIQVNPPETVQPAASGPHPRFAVSTLGCKVNSFESELIAQKLVAGNYQRVRENDAADLYIVNTCTVTAEADRQARQTVRRAIRRNPDSRIVVTGCYAQMDPEACAMIPGVDLVVGNSQKLDIPSLLESLSWDSHPKILMRDIDSEMSIPDQLLHGFDGRSRAFVQIQQGCDQGCTFCIIHVARGPNRSFDGKLIRRQCERLIMNGYREIVLCGVDVGSYGSDLSGNPGELTDLMASLVELEGDFRIRLSSIDPVHITEDLVSVLAGSDKICPQLHLSLQSGNTLILKRMKRRATREVLFERVAMARERIPGLVLSADILVGFPTETRSQFEDTLDAIDRLEIPFPHVFGYSKRPGTPAARIPNQVAAPEIKERVRTARRLGEKVWERVAARQAGRMERVLVESVLMPSPSGLPLVKSRSGNYFPVWFHGENVDPGGWATVRISGVEDRHLLAETMV